MPQRSRENRRSRTGFDESLQSRDGARDCWTASVLCDDHQGVDCCVRVVVTVVAGGGTVVVEVRSVVVVCVVGPGPQAASNPMPPRSIAASSSRMAGLVLVKVYLLVHRGSDRSRARTGRA